MFWSPCERDFMRVLNRKSEKGFSLVELAISVTVVGFLIAAVLKGGEVLENARVASTISQVKTYTVAASTFKELYGAYPGDISDAVIGCGASCASGDGDGEIESAAGRDPSWNMALQADDESFQFWKHLAVSELISDVKSTADGDAAADMSFGVTNPKSNMGGGFDVWYDSDFQPDGLDLGRSGHFIRLFNANFNIRPLAASSMDRKMDDGQPYTGQVMSGGEDCVSGTPAISSNYDTSQAARACFMFFKFGGRRG